MKNMIITHASNKLISTFNNIFLGIYFLKLTKGNVQSVIIFYLIKFLCVPIYSYVVCNMIKKNNVVKLYRLGILLNSLSFLILIILGKNIINYIYLYAILSPFTSQLYWEPYKTMIYTLNGDEKFKKFNAYNNIVGNVISILSTIGMGYVIVKLSYIYLFAIIFVISFIAYIVTFKFEEKDYKISKFKNSNLKPLLKDKKARHIYRIVFYEGVGYCGALTTAIQLVIFLKLGSEFSLGYLNALFSVLGIVTALIVSKFLKKEYYIKAYILSSISIILSIVPIIISSNFKYFIVYNVVFNIAYQITSILMNSAIFNIKSMKIINECRLEYTFLQESIHAYGKAVGEIVLFLIAVFFYNLQNLQIAVAIFSATILLQSLEYRKLIQSNIKN